MSAAPFRASGTALLAALPAAMVLANRSAPLVVILAALLFAVAAFAEQGPAALADLARPLRSPPGIAALGFLAWCLVSFAWSPFPSLSLRTLGEFGPTLVGAFVLARLAPGRLPGWAVPLASAMLAGACLYAIASLASGMAPQRALGQRDALFVLNRPALTILLIAGPLALLAASRVSPLVAGLTLVLPVAAILASVSGAAAMGLIAGAAMFAAAWWLPRPLALVLGGLGLGLALVLAPVEGDVLDRSMPEAAHERLVHSSSRARVAIARSFGGAVAADPWRGAGYGIGARFAEAPVARDFEPEMRKLLGVGHPHNSFLQVWAELGVVGAVLAGAVLFLMLEALAALPRATCAAALGLVAAAAAVAFVEHGAWQAWWTAALGAAITWLRQDALERAKDKESG